MSLSDTFQHLGRSLRYSEIIGVSALKFIPGEILKKASRKLFAQKLTSLKGVPLKMSQILSMSAKEEDQDLYHEANQNIEALDLKYFLPYLNSEAHHLIEEIETISEQAHPASLGQVHQIHLKNGQCLALKLQYPNSEANMDLDQSLLGLISNTFQSFKEGFHLSDYQKVLQDELQQELNYRHELMQQNYLYQAFQDIPQIVIPQPYSSLSGEKHIVMNYEVSTPILEFCKNASEDDRYEATRLLSLFFFTSILKYGKIYADPNPGNLGFRKNNQGLELVIYDFGSIIDFPDQQRIYLLKLLQEVDQSQGVIKAWLVALGFNEQLLSPIQDRLLAFLDLLFEPILASNRFNLEDWNRKKRAKEILGKDRWSFMLSAPASLIGLMRSIQGFFHYTSKLNVGVYLRPLVEEFWGNSNKELNQCIPPILREGPSFSKMAKHLHIHVKENNKDKVYLTLPRSSIEELESLIDENLKNKLSEQNIQTDQLVSKAREEAYQPMSLFKVSQDNGKEVHVYLK